MWWCERGSLVVVVDAPSAGVAAERALVLFRQRGRVQYDQSVSVREASPADVALWELLRAQSDAGVDGCRVGAEERVEWESEQSPLFA